MKLKDRCPCGAPRDPRLIWCSRCWCMKELSYAYCEVCDTIEGRRSALRGAASRIRSIYRWIGTLEPAIGGELKPEKCATCTHVWVATAGPGGGTELYCECCEMSEMAYFDKYGHLPRESK